MYDELNDGDPQVRLQALRRIWSQNAQPAFYEHALRILKQETDTEILVVAAQKLAQYLERHPEQATLQLRDIYAIREFEEKVRYELIALLGFLPPETALDILITTFKESPSLLIRAACATALVRFDDPTVADALMDVFLHAKDRGAHHTIADRIGQQGDPRVVPALLKTYQEHDSIFMREVALKALGYFHESDRFNAPELFKDALTHPNRNLFKTALQCYARPNGIRDEQVTNRLIELLQLPSPSSNDQRHAKIDNTTRMIREDAVKALSYLEQYDRIKAAFIESITMEYLHPNAPIRWLIQHYGNAARGELLTAVKHNPALHAQVQKSWDNEYGMLNR